MWGWVAGPLSGTETVTKGFAFCARAKSTRRSPLELAKVRFAPARVVAFPSIYDRRALIIGVLLGEMYGPGR